MLYEFKQQDLNMNINNFFTKLAIFIGVWFFFGVLDVTFEKQTSAEATMICAFFIVWNLDSCRENKK